MNRPRKRVQKKFTQPSLTKQSFRDECDISVIVRNFAVTGTLPQKRQEPQYGVAHGDFQEAQFALAAARSTFETLSPEVRAKYGDLNEIVRAMNDPARASELASDGIFNAYGIPDTPEVEKHGTGELVPETKDSSPADSPQGGAEGPSEASPSQPKG